MVNHGKSSVNVHFAMLNDSCLVWIAMLKVPAGTRRYPIGFSWGQLRPKSAQQAQHASHACGSQPPPQAWQTWLKALGSSVELSSWGLPLSPSHPSHWTTIETTDWWRLGIPHDLSNLHLSSLIHTDPWLFWGNLVFSNHNYTQITRKTHEMDIEISSNPMCA